MDKRKQFIYTMDVSIANLLEDQSFTFLSSNNGTYIFMNDSKLMFSDESKDIERKILNKIAYTNVLCF